MFYHAYRSYMDNAYPADELMPLSCQGRYRGVTPSRGDMDDVLGKCVLNFLYFISLSLLTWCLACVNCSTHHLTHTHSCLIWFTNRTRKHTQLATLVDFFVIRRNLFMFLTRKYNLDKYLFTLDSFETHMNSPVCVTQ